MLTQVKQNGKKVVKLSGVGHKYSVLVHLKDKEVDVRKDEE